MREKDGEAKFTQQQRGMNGGLECLQIVRISATPTENV